MEQEKPTTPVFSIADELQRRQKQADERRAAWEQKRQRAADLYRDGQNPILAYIDTLKPQRDTERIKRTQMAAKIAAWSNFLSALGTGIVGMATEGYIPKTGNDAPMKMLGKIDEWDKLYNSQNREYQQLRLRALMGQQQGEQQAANMDATAAGQDYTQAQKQYDTLIGNLWKAQQEKEKRADVLNYKLQIEKVRGENTIKAAQIRGENAIKTTQMRGETAIKTTQMRGDNTLEAAQMRGDNNLKIAQIRADAAAATASSRATAAANKSVVQFLDRDEKAVVSLTPAQESLLYEKGRKMGIIPDDGSPTKQPSYTGEKVPLFVYGKLKPAQKAELLRSVYLKLDDEQRAPKKPQPTIDTGLMFNPQKRYVTGPLSGDILKILETPQAEQMREAGYSDQQIINYYLDYE